jgi:hypothetical protein
MHAKYHNPWITPSGRKFTGTERKRRRKNTRKNAVKRGHFVQRAKPKCHTLTLLRPKY